MLHIRPEQMEAFRAAMLSNLEQRIVAHVRETWPEECRELGDGAVRTMVAEGMARARTYGLEAEIDVAAFVDFLFLLGPGFDTENPVAHAALTSPELPAGSKIDCIEAWIAATDAEDGEGAE